MPPVEPDRAQRGAWAELRHSLVRRRWTALDRGLRIELSILALLMIGFVFWQARIPFDGLFRESGGRAVAISVLSLEAALALLGAALAGIRHARDLLTGPPGPAWLVLPVPTPSLRQHLAWEARTHALWAALPVPGLLLAATGLAPVWSIPLLLLLFVAMLWGASHLAMSAAYALAVRSRRPRAGVEPLVAMLAAASRPPAPLARSRLRWPAGPSWRAIMTKDLWLSVKPTRARWRLAIMALLVFLSLVCWFLPVPLPLARLAAFALGLVSAAACGEWLIALAGMDPFQVLRGLPVGVSTLWGSRSAWALLIALMLVALHALVARNLSPHALGLFLAWTGGGALAIALLAVNYGITLFPRADLAQRMFSLTLGLCLAASLMIPLMGWVVMASAVLHSARRLPRWPRLEDRM